MYLFYNSCTNLYVSNEHFFHHQEFVIYCILQLCANHADTLKQLLLICIDMCWGKMNRVYSVVKMCSIIKF